MAGSNGHHRRRVVITGIGTVTPVGIGVDPYWEALLAGRSGIAPIRGFDTDGQRVHIAGEVSDFDPADWLEAKEIKRVDRFCHFALVAADLALADAEFDPPNRDRVATVFATGAAGLNTGAREALNLHTRGPRLVSPFTIPCVIPNMAAGHITMRHGFGGPNICPVSACASSADAVGWGYRLVRDGYADACLAGGSEAPVNPFALAAFANLRALSTRNDDPLRASRPFDAERDGFLLAEGGGALVLEPLEDALARGARVYAEVCGYGQASDAYHETAPDPDGTGAARAIREALAEADVSPSDVDYVNAHGTSTPLADAIETRALRNVLGDRARHVPVSSTKSMTGHLLGGAGAIEAAACALALRDGAIPPTINYENPDSECEALDFVPNEARYADIDVALSNAMGFGGHDVCLVFRNL